ncbi:MAG: hypothetical protein K1X50_08710 [Candidatus Promineofilum sp.]|nr:hypothetical protein [Promineifilum sp.]MCW5864811.1 hypothetical protein [Anaerolineae bacterium]
MKKTLKKNLVVLLLVFGALSCQPQPSEQPLTTDLDLEQLETFESAEYGISFGMPTGWQVVEGEPYLILTSDPHATFSFDEAHYHIWTMSRRFGLGISSRIFPKSAYQIASIIKNPSLNPSDYSIGPITRTTVSGRAGAYYFEEASFSSNYQYYTIVIELNDDVVVILHADGPGELSELMRSTLNAIALTVEPLDD